MSAARKLPLADDPRYQTSKRRALADVPSVPENAIQFDGGHRSDAYNLGRQRWRTRIGDRSKILTYILYRDPVDIENGAHPWLELYTDGSL